MGTSHTRNTPNTETKGMITDMKIKFKNFDIENEVGKPRIEMKNGRKYSKN